MTLFVLDASITMRWFFEAGSHPRADALLEKLATFADTAVVPMMWRYEAGAVLARAQWRGQASAGEVAGSFEDLSDLPIQTDVNSRIFEARSIAAGFARRRAHCGLQTGGRAAGLICRKANARSGKV